MASNEALLQEIRDNFDYAVQQWRPIREEGREDMRYVAGDPWPDQERKAREANGRLCLTFDELNQYTNQQINNVRQNKRGIKVTPKGNGATPDTALWRGGIIKEIEYRSKAQQAYTTAYQNAIHRSYGWVKVKTEWVSPHSRDQHLTIVRIPNPDVILPDPDFKEADASDMEFLFELDSMRDSRFRRRWKDAQVQNFSRELAELAPDWIKPGDGNSWKVQVAAYWKVKRTPRTLIYLPNGDDVFLDEIEGAKLDGDFAVLPSGERLKTEGYSDREDNEVCQYITNGVEILEKHEWAGTTIPYAPCIGQELYVDDGGGSKRQWRSLVRGSRQPFLSYCYMRTAQMELAGQYPKTLVMGYEGQFETATDWENIAIVPSPYAEIKAKTTATGEAILPHPARIPFDPPIAALEIGAEAARRAIQAAMGGSPLPTAAQRENQKSGVALARIEQSSDEGNFHFVDAYNVMLERVGNICDELIGPIYDSERDQSVIIGADEHHTIRLNGPGEHPKTKQPMLFKTDEGDHGITISVGESFQSEREEASRFADTLTSIPEVFPRIADLVIKLKNLGPIGDELAKRLAPADADSPIPAGVQQQIQQGGQLIQALTERVQQLQQRLDSKSDDNQTKLQIAAMQEETKRTIALAQLNSEEGLRKLEAELGLMQQRLDLIHQSTMKAADIQHAQETAALAPDDPAAITGGAGQQPQAQ